MYYKLNPKMNAELVKLFEAIKPFIIDNAQSKKDIKMAEKLYKRARPGFICFSGNHDSRLMKRV